MPDPQNGLMVQLSANFSVAAAGTASVSVGPLLVGDVLDEIIILAASIAGDSGHDADIIGVGIHVLNSRPANYGEAQNGRALATNITIPPRITAFDSLDNCSKFVEARIPAFHVAGRQERHVAVTFDNAQGGVGYKGAVLFKVFRRVDPKLT